MYQVEYKGNRPGLYVLAMDMASKTCSLLITILLTVCMVSSVCLASGNNELVVAKPFGPSVELPDPAKGSNGWYTGEAGVTETLFVLDFNMHLQPLLVKSHRNISPFKWEIHLKEGIMFHDHTCLDASAVKWSLERLVDERSPSFNKRIQGLLDIRSITVQDKYCLIFETNRPNAAFLYNLTTPETGIVSSNIDRGRLCGTGPFMLDKVIPEEKMVVKRFDRYWGERPRLRKALFVTIKNPITRMLSFESGQVDVAVNFPENDAVSIMSQPDVRIVHRPTARVCFFFVRVKDGPLASPIIRKAINYAIDRQEIVKTILSDIGGRAGGTIFPDVLPWSNRAIAPYPYDPERALQLLKSAGARDSNHDGILEIDCKPICLSMWTYTTRPALKPTLELVQAQLARIGIASKLHVTQRASPINRAMDQGLADLNLQMWNTAPQGDPDYLISDIFITGARSNHMGYHNPEVDALAQRGRATFDIKKRKKIYDRIQKIIFEQSPVIVLFYKSDVTALRRSVQGYRIHPAEKYLLTPWISKK